MAASRDHKQSVDKSATPPLELKLCTKTQDCMKTAISDRNSKSILKHSNSKSMTHFKMQKKFKWSHGNPPNEKLIVSHSEVINVIKMMIVMNNIKLIYSSCPST